MYLVPTQNAELVMLGYSSLKARMYLLNSLVKGSRR
jgi:hypothetical protein